MIRLATFDMAGTTIDEGHHVYRVLEESVVREGVSLSPADFQDWMGVEKREAIANLLRVGGIEASEERIDGAFAWFLDTLATTYQENPPRPSPASRTPSRSCAAAASRSRSRRASRAASPTRCSPPWAGRPVTATRRRRSTRSSAPTRCAAGDRRPT